MRSIIFRKEAEADLQGIIGYYDEAAPASVANILSDVYRSVDRLVHFPHLGMQIEDRNYRRIVTLKHHFKIAYEVGDDRFVILGIFRYRDREV